MASARFLIPFAALLAIAAPAKASAAPAPADPKADVSAFIQSYGEAFWNSDELLCIRVRGLEPDKAAQVKARVEADARAAGVSVGRAECGLRYQVEIFFDADSERVVRDTLHYYNDPMWPLPFDRPTGADRPIRAWYGVVYDHAGLDERRLSDFRPDPRDRKKLAMAIVVVDPRRTQDMSLDAVADYVAMLSLAQPRSLDRCNVLPSVTDLFAGACPGRPAPAGLTAADAAYLKALYTGSPGIRATRYPFELVDHMAKLLGVAAKAAPAAVPNARARAPGATLIRVAEPAQARAPADPKPQASEFVRAYAAFTAKRELIARWYKAICVQVTGLAQVQQAAVRARIEQTAGAVGVGVQPAGCPRTNIEIGFANDPQAMLDDQIARRPWLLGDSTSGSQVIRTVTRPIQAWYVTNGEEYAANDTAGLKALVAVQDPNYFTTGPGSVQSGVGSAPQGDNFPAAPGSPPRALLNVMVIVDLRRTGGRSLSQLADYAAMLALSQPRSLDRCAVLPSIIDLFADPCPGRAGPRGLTPADMAYLTALNGRSSGFFSLSSPTVDEVAARMAKLLDTATLAAN
jgi:hypothetical protein